MFKEGEDKNSQHVGYDFKIYSMARTLFDILINLVYSKFIIVPSIILIRSCIFQHCWSHVLQIWPPNQTVCWIYWRYTYEQNTRLGVENVECSSRTQTATVQKVGVADNAKNTLIILSLRVIRFCFTHFCFSFLHFFDILYSWLCFT